MLNNISFLNFKSNLQPIKKNNNYSVANNITAPKLAPLEKDTLNFTGVVEYRAAINNGELCRTIHNRAIPVNNWLKGTLEKYFVEDTYDAKKNPDGYIEHIQARVKSGDSIEEKVSDKIRAALETKKGNTKELIFSPTSEIEIKDRVRDISGGRIVIKNAHGKNMQKAVDSLCKMIREEKLIIDEIEYHHPKVEKGERDIKPYFTREQINQIVEAANSIEKPNNKKITAQAKYSESGYMALHLSIDTRNKSGASKNPINQGFYSELQIIGSDVAMLKDIEDFCYKLKKGMSIRSGDCAYVPFQDMFLEAYTPKVQKYFKEYTKAAYKAQRMRRPSIDPKDDIKDWSYKYPTIKECGFEGKIPPILDFNILARIKRDCDDLYYVKNHTEEILNEVNQLPKVTN